MQAFLFGSGITPVDSGVTAALSAVLIAPESAAAYWLDIIGSLIVAIYLVRCGVLTVYDEWKQTRVKSA